MSVPAEPLISLQNVTKRYGKFLALNDITAEIPSGVIGLLGPNGAGKSTLIKMLSVSYTHLTLPTTPYV